MQAMIPIVYLSSESLGCILAYIPDYKKDLGNEWDRLLDPVYKQCGNIVTSNHAMAFHLSMLLVVKLYVLPFEELHITVNDIKNWNLKSKHQILLITMLIASLSALFIFATRREGTNKYTYVNDTNITHVLLMVLHCCWGVAFITFGLDAIVQAKREEAGKEPKKEKKPFWNKWLSKADPYAIAPIYRYFVCTLLLLLPLNVCIGALTTRGESYKWVSVVSGSLSLHLALGAVYIASNVRRRGYPLRELFVYIFCVVGVLGVMLYNEVKRYGVGRPVKVLELIFGVCMLIIFWPIVLHVRGLIKHMPNHLLKNHIRDIVFRGSSAFFSPLIFISMESINCPLTLDIKAEDYRDGMCDGIVVPCSTMCHHIFFALMFNLFFRPHVVLDVKKIMTLDGIPWYRVVQLFCVLLATIVSLYVYATRNAMDDRDLTDNQRDLADLSYDLRNAAVVIVFMSWTVAFTAELIVIKMGIERVRQVAVIEDEILSPPSSSLALTITTTKQTPTTLLGDPEPESEPEAPTPAPTTEIHESLSSAYTTAFRVILYSLGCGCPFVHVFYRNYFSYYFMTLIEVPVLLRRVTARSEATSWEYDDYGRNLFFSAVLLAPVVVMNFASSPKSWASKRAKLLLVMPYPIFNLLFLLGDLIALAVDDKDTLRKEPYFNNIAGRITIIFCSSFCFPLISDTASRITQSFSPQRTERFLNSVFSRAAFMMIPLLYLTFEASAKVIAFLFLHTSEDETGWAENGYNRPEVEALVKTCHVITFHLVMSWCLLVFIAPFKRQATTKELYMFNLSWHMRLQASAGFVGSVSSLILFAVRHAWHWGGWAKFLALLCKTTWFVIIVLEVREIRKEESDRDHVFNDIDDKGGDNRFSRSSQSHDDDEYANELELCEF
ncbi:hypothetical protein TL16_g05139 [Triparma laevis f. inornata]|uniref:Transmembrane protein n=1 Tax=Triparma laevis f. inornata TaxID=1714386 RepID=A0A9W7AEZ1_9STRA|nr:hypothetical protein TL16_g05139 [Triparma laevis f. inornata]